MSDIQRITNELHAKGWFASAGAYVLTDGQFGSTGKGLLASLLAQVGAGEITHCTTNAGPNSGHTAYFDLQKSPGGPSGVDEIKIVTQQVPVASVVLELMGMGVETHINAGAIVDEEILGREVSEWLHPDTVLVHPNAALISDDARLADQDIVGRIAGTGKGVGPALQAKLGRDRSAVCGGSPHMSYGLIQPRTWDQPWRWERDVVFVETAQGFSLGLNSARFYPNVTTRECTVGQALADARIAPSRLRKVAVCYRTFPIRVGNSPEGGYSGDAYPDQHEITFADIGQPDEITTVTKRVRRLFTWSRQQFRESVAANEPDLLFINFANYMDPASLDYLLGLIVLDYTCVMGHKPETILLGFGPRATDIRLHENY